MIKELTIKNFRSIREASLELGRFTVLNGANNSGKSSVLYALQVLKNVVTNPNQSLDSLLNLSFLDLGGIGETVFGKKKETGLKLGITSESNVYRGIVAKFAWEFQDTHGNSFHLEGISPHTFKGKMGISFPYSLVKSEEIEIEYGDEENEKIILVWNGIGVNDIIDEDEGYLDSEGYDELETEANLPTSDLFQLDFVPTRRGFTKPSFNSIPLRNGIYSEDEVATLLVTDKDLKNKVSYYFEKITDKQFSVSMVEGFGFFYLKVREPKSGFTTELVNQGMGVNQILFLLAKILYDKNRLICIDEPEIHLHPTLIEQFVKVLVEIAEKEDKQFIFSTHSEHWLMSMLAEVNDGNLKAEDLKVYYLTKEEQETKVEGQQVHPNGQIEGGLKNFLEAQMRLANRFFDHQPA